jgi:hypothetical protein
MIEKNVGQCHPIPVRAGSKMRPFAQLLTLAFGGMARQHAVAIEFRTQKIHLASRLALSQVCL